MSKPYAIRSMLPLMVTAITKSHELALVRLADLKETVAQDAAAVVLTNTPAKAARVLKRMNSALKRTETRVEQVAQEKEALVNAETLTLTAFQSLTPEHKAKFNSCWDLYRAGKMSPESFAQALKPIAKTLQKVIDAPATSEPVAAE